MTDATPLPQQQPGAPPRLSPVLEELTKKTIDILARVIKKPPLTQKLLAKPPFRYLHDIFSELIRLCAFVPGLYSEAEMNSENIKDKEAKVQYLTKMIDCIGIATGLEIRANPLKIVAGLEPEETNAFLQLIGKVLIKKVDTKNAIARVLAGEHQGKKSVSAPTKTDTPPTVSKSVSEGDQAKKLQNSEVQKDIPVKVHAAPAAHSETIGLKGHNETGHQAPAAQSSKPGQSSHIQKETSPAIQHISSTDKLQEPANSKPPPVLSPAKPADREQPQVLENSESFSKTVPVDSSTEELANDSNPDHRFPQATIRRRERPISARPAPPKQRPPQVAIEKTLVDSPAIITDGKQKDDDDDDFVVKAMESLQPKPAIGSGLTLSADEKHGGLVQRILQTKKNLEGELEDTTIKRDTAATPKDPKSKAIKDIGQLRESIQLLCQSTNPLGKTMDYMQEDVDSMNKEFDEWRLQSQSFKVIYEAEAKSTLDSLKPLELQLKTIEESIELQYEKIATVKATIIQNDVSIQKILKAITAPHK
ncbi:hypothetical protein MT418_002175 [Batrachochytrium dendrobatidis]